MANFCRKCGARLDESTGRCPQCQGSSWDNTQVQGSGAAGNGHPAPQTPPQPERRGMVLNIILVGLIAAAFILIALLTASLILDKKPAEVGNMISSVFIHRGPEAAEPGSAPRPGSKEEKHVHVWTPATCTSPKTCRICEETSGTPLGHSWEKEPCKDYERCSSCGLIRDAVGEHDWQSNGILPGEVCKNCGKTRGGAVATWKGNNVLFGKYEQDNDLHDGKEPIEWIILKQETDRILLISRYGLDSQAFHAYTGDLTWEASSLRRWLNGSFMQSAFTEEEQKQICLVEVPGENNPNYHTPGGNDTMDKIFLFSVDEAAMYLDTNEKRVCEPTDYAIERGVFYENGVTYWWLRTPGSYADRTTGVNGDGTIHMTGSRVTDDTNAVRPVIWLKIK